MLSTIVARVLPDTCSSRVIGELVSQQTAAYNQAVTLLNRGISIPKRSGRESSQGFNRQLTEWRDVKGPSGIQSALKGCRSPQQAMDPSTLTAQACLPTLMSSKGPSGTEVPFQKSWCSGPQQVCNGRS